ncbi:MAG: DMT family transporter [Pseudomonadota bacterium]
MQKEKLPNIVLVNTLCFLSMAMWAFAFPIADVLLQTWGSISLGLARQAIALFTLLLMWCYLDGFVTVTRAPWLRGMIIGGIGFGVGAPLLLYGQRLSDPVTPALAAAMMPVAGAMLEVLFDQRKMTIWLWIGIALALCGGVLASGARLQHASFGIGALLCLVSVVLFAWASRAATTHCRELSAMGQSTVTMAGAALVLSTFVIIAKLFALPGAAVGKLDTTMFLLLLFSGAVSLGVSQFLWIWAVGKIGVFLASVHMNAVPFYVMVIAVLALGASWSWMQSAGVMLVALGVMVTQLATARRHGRLRV